MFSKCSDLFFLCSGYLEREELKKFLTMKGVKDVCDDDVKYILDVADINGDGRIDTAGTYLAGQ